MEKNTQFVSCRNADRIAVLLAAYNGEKYLSDQIDSILNQTKVDLDLYISLDKSDDSSLEIIKSYVENYSNIFLLEYGERFGSAGKNFFRLIEDVDFTGYGYVSLSDQDDVWFPWKLLQAKEAIDNGCSAYSCNAIAYYKGQRAFEVVKSQKIVEYDYIFESGGHGCTYVLDSCALGLFKSKMIENKSKLDKISQHDWLIYAYFRHNNLKWYIDTDFCMLYRQHEINDFGVNEGVGAYFSRFRKVKNGWFRKQVERNLDFIDFRDFFLNRKLKLLSSIHLLRRRKRDRIALFVFILFGFF